MSGQVWEDRNEAICTSYKKCRTFDPSFLHTRKSCAVYNIHTQPSSHVHACVSVCAYVYNTADREKLNEGPNDVINKTYDVRVTNERLHVTKNHN